jgi:hypothetical protein
MKNVATNRRNRKTSTVQAGGVTSHGTPRGEHGSLPGSNGRSFLTLQCRFGLAQGQSWQLWDVVQVDFEGSLGYERRTPVVEGCLSVLEASQELALWCEGTGLPCRDFRSTETFDPAGDPGWL